MLKVNRVEQHIIEKNHEMWNTIDEYCFRSKNLYNYANYIVRQEFINCGRWVRYAALDKMLQRSEAYLNLGSQASQKTLELLDKNWKSFFKSIKDWAKNKDKYLGKPRMPNYKDKINGRFILTLKNIQCRINNELLQFSWKPFREFKIKTKVSGRLIQVRFSPKKQNYVLELVYEINVPERRVESSRVVGVDLGVNNLATVSNNVLLNPFVVNGRATKSVNQYFNKKKACTQRYLKQSNNKNWSNRLQKLSNKRANKIKDHLHRSSRYIVRWCLTNQIDTIIVGKNPYWKQEVSMGRRNNQNFSYIPFEIFINQLKYKSEDVGINFIETEESYTSGTSFLDNEPPTKEYYDKSRRIKRGLFKSDCGRIINADLNASYQIVKKVFPNAFSDGIEGVGLHPVKVNLN